MCHQVLNVVNSTFNNHSEAIPRVMGASVSSGAHSGFGVVLCSKEDEEGAEGDEGSNAAADCFDLAGDFC